MGREKKQLTKEERIANIQLQIDSGKLPDHVKEKFLKQIDFIQNEDASLPSFIAFLCYPTHKVLVYIDRTDKDFALISRMGSNTYPLEEGEYASMLIQIYPEE